MRLDVPIVRGGDRPHRRRLLLRLSSPLERLRNLRVLRVADDADVAHLHHRLQLHRRHRSRSFPRLTPGAAVLGHPAAREPFDAVNLLERVERRLRQLHVHQHVPGERQGLVAGTIPRGHRSEQIDPRLALRVALSDAEIIVRHPRDPRRDRFALRLFRPGDGVDLVRRLLLAPLRHLAHVPPHVVHRALEVRLPVQIAPGDVELRLTRRVLARVGHRVPRVFPRRIVGGVDAQTDADVAEDVRVERDVRDVRELRRPRATAVGNPRRPGALRARDGPSPRRRELLRRLIGDLLVDADSRASGVASRRRRRALLGDGLHLTHRSRSHRGDDVLPGGLGRQGKGRITSE